MPFPEIIDNSMREAWVKCPQFFFRKYVQNWDHPVPSVHLHAGAAYAKGLEVLRREFYDRGATPQAALLAATRALISTYGDFETDTAKTLWNTVSALVFYFDTYPLATDYITPWRSGDESALEFTFAIPLPITHPETGNPLLYAGRFDMLANLRGALCIYDDKTTSQLGKQWANNWLLSSQMTGYIWAAQQYGFATNCFVIRGVSITAAGNHGTEEYIGYRQPWMIERWYEQLLDEIHAMLRAYETNRYPLNQSKSCAGFSGCEFLSVCTSPNPDRWLESNFARRAYNPLTIGA